MNSCAKKFPWFAITFAMACHAFAQNPGILPGNRAYHDASSRKEVEAYAATNKIFARAIDYFIATIDGNQPLQLPNGVTPEDISNAVLKVFPRANFIFDRPISFYGRVLDEKNQPVSGANVHFEWKGFLIHGSLTADVLSDQAGLVSLTNKTGTELEVSVGKSDYYTSHRNRGVQLFRYAVDFGAAFKPDPNQPVLYYLHKKGAGADTLITSQFGIREDYWVKIPPDGTKVNVDLVQRKIGSGPLEISQVKPDRANWKNATEWSFSMKIADGGFIEEGEEFAFHPPQSGYQPLVGFKFEKGQTNWTTDLRKDYYIRFGNPPLYGQLHLETSIFSSSAMLLYVVNPDGSQNLEPKQTTFPSSSTWAH